MKNSSLMTIAIVFTSVFFPGSPCLGQTPTAKDILGNPKYQAISYGGYRKTSRDDQPTVKELKEDLRILSAMGIRILRTYNTQQYAQAENLLKAIAELKLENPDFEMYVMLGAWIDCEGGWGPSPNHEAGSVENNTAEINAAVALAKRHPDTVKIIAVGNEAMVHWAASYFVRPKVILKWVNHLQKLKAAGELPTGLWITSSDNFASWGGGEASYHTDSLTALIKAVDYVSMHTYPFHDTHYNGDFWKAPVSETKASPEKKARAAMTRAVAYAKSQHQSTAAYIKSLGIKKPIHIGETGWASASDSFYGQNGSNAADEFKLKLFHDGMRQWTNKSRMSCFFFEAFDEHWKDASNPQGSENHFGLMTLDGKAKYPLWPLVDAGRLKGLTRAGNPIRKTYGGDTRALLRDLLVVPSAPSETASAMVNTNRKLGEPVNEQTYVVPIGSTPSADLATLPSAEVRANIWEGTCAIDRPEADVIRIRPGSGAWWGCGLEIQGNGKGENLSRFRSGKLHFEVRGETQSAFDIGFQTGRFADGSQTNNHTRFAHGAKYQLSPDWTKYSLPIAKLCGKNTNLRDVTSLLYFRGENRADDKALEVRNISWSTK